MSGFFSRHNMMNGPRLNILLIRGSQNRVVKRRMYAALG